jgi:hypothetical protein
MTKVIKFEVLSFTEEVKGEDGKTTARPVILLYALGDDGIIYEMSGGKWFGLSINEANMRKVEK